MREGNEGRREQRKEDKADERRKGGQEGTTNEPPVTVCRLRNSVLLPRPEPGIETMGNELIGTRGTPNRRVNSAVERSHRASSCSSSADNRAARSADRVGVGGRQIFVLSTFASSSDKMSD